MPPLTDLSPQACLSTPESQRCDATLPDNPQCTLNYHFGMLLGVDDFRAEQGFHLGRSRRHQRLLHGVGVVAGYAIDVDADTFDLRVSPGLAVDALGRDLVLDQAQCVNLAQWWLKHRGDEAFDDVANPDDATVDIDVTVCYSTCLSSPVPAIAEPCAGNAADTAYSRVCETVSMQLVRRTASTPAPLGMLPLLSPCGNPADLAQALANVSIDLPQPTDPAALCLSLVCLRGVHFKLDAKGWHVSVARLDWRVRPLLLPTAALQALLMPAVAGTPPAAGPLVTQAGQSGSDTVVLTFDQRLAQASVQPAAFAVSEFDTTLGWQQRVLLSAAYTEPPGGAPTVTLLLDQAVTGALLRITAIGNGSSPLLGHNLTPAGATHPDCDGRSLTTTIHRG